MSLSKFLILSLLIFSCNTLREKKQDSKENSININVNGSRYTMRDTVITYNKSKVLQRYVIELKDSLKMNKLPDFVYDECLDANSMGYCSVSSHETISLRTDIISMLNKEDIKKILDLGNKEQLKKKCKNDYTSELFNSNKSTFEILVEASQ